MGSEDHAAAKIACGSSHRLQGFDIEKTGAIQNRVSSVFATPRGRGFAQLTNVNARNPKSLVEIQLFKRNKTG